jgi:predicted nucleic acid-binding protein
LSVPGTLVDSNVIFDLLSDDEEWADWSAAMIADAGDRGPVVINPIIFAEVSVRYDRIEDIEAALPRDYFVRASLPWDAGFLAAKCFDRYRRRGGTRRSPLPAYHLGAHAAVSALPALTRDPRRSRNYFPKLTIIAP